MILCVVGCISQMMVMRLPCIFSQKIYALCSVMRKSSGVAWLLGL